MLLPEAAVHRACDGLLPAATDERENLGDQISPLSCKRYHCPLVRAGSGRCKLYVAQKYIHATQRNKPTAGKKGKLIGIVPEIMLHATASIRPVCMRPASCHAGNSAPQKGTTSRDSSRDTGGLKHPLPRSRFKVLLFAVLTTVW